MPEFSLQRKRIFRFSVSSSSSSANSRTAMDLDLPAPKRPCINRSSRLVNSAIVTAHSVPRTWPSSSAAKDSAVVLIYACDSLSM